MELHWHGLVSVEDIRSTFSCSECFLPCSQFFIPNLVVNASFATSHHDDVVIQQSGLVKKLLQAAVVFVVLFFLPLTRDEVMQLRQSVCLDGVCVYVCVNFLWYGKEPIN